MLCDTCGKPITYRQEYFTFLRGMCDNDNGDGLLAAHRLCGALPKGQLIDFVASLRSSPKSWPHTAIEEMGDAPSQ